MVKETSSTEPPGETPSSMLLKLPNEILAAISKEIASSAFTFAQDLEESGIYPLIRRYPDPYTAQKRLTTLYNLCLVCRRLRYVSQATLYHEFSLGYGDDDASTYCTSFDGRLASFIKTLIDRRDLATSVRRAYIHPRLLAAMTDDEAADAIWEGYRFLGEVMPLELRQLLKEDYQNKPTCVSIVAFALMPNLEHFVLQPAVSPDSWKRHTEDGGLQRSYWPPPHDLGTFQRLKSLDIVSTYQFCLYLRQFPCPQGSITTLTLHGMPENVQGLPLHYFPHLRNLTVFIDNSGMPIDPLPLLGDDGLAGLRSFHFIGPAYRFYSDRAHKVISAILSHHSQNLRHLTFDVRNSAMDASEIIGSFKRLNNLETLFISGNCLASADADNVDDPHRFYANMLPPSLKRLWVVGTAALVDDRVILGLCDAVMDGTLPNLKTFGCSPILILKDHEAYLKRSMAPHGIDFSFNVPAYGASINHIEGPLPPDDNIYRFGA